MAVGNVFTIQKTPGEWPIVIYLPCDEIKRQQCIHCSILMIIALICLLTSSGKEETSITHLDAIAKVSAPTPTAFLAASDYSCGVHSVTACLAASDYCCGVHSVTACLAASARHARHGGRVRGRPRLGWMDGVKVA